MQLMEEEKSCVYFFLTQHTYSWFKQQQPIAARTNMYGIALSPVVDRAPTHVTNNFNEFLDRWYTHGVTAYPSTIEYHQPTGHLRRSEIFYFFLFLLFIIFFNHLTKRPNIVV